MPPRRPRCKIRTANLLTRREYFSVPLRGPGFLLPIANCRMPILAAYAALSIGNRQFYSGVEPGACLLACAEFLDEGHAIDLVQGRNSAKNLLQSRLSQTRESLGLR